MNTKTTFARLATDISKRETRKRYILSVLIFLAPLIVFSQPFVFDLGAYSILIARMIVAPLLLIMFYPKQFHWNSLTALLALVVLTSYPGLAKQQTQFFVHFLALFGAIIFFRFGVVIAGKTDSDANWLALIYSITLLNLVTLILLNLVVQGVIDYAFIYESVQRDIEYGISRFSLGSPIELPFILSALLYVGISFMPSNRTFMIPAILNLAAAAISQSRVVLLIAVLITVKQWIRSTKVVRFLSIIVILTSLSLTWDYFEPVFTSIGDRYNGQDDGSAEDRRALVGKVLSEMDPEQLIIGKGITSAAQSMLRSTGTYRSVESLLLEKFYEIGIIGIFLLIASGIAGNSKYLNREIIFDYVYWLLWIQLLFFLPSTNLMPLSALAMGMLSSKSSSKMANNGQLQH